MDERFSEIEEELCRVPGIRSARIVGDSEPTEIHVVATKERPPKQLVRDVQSLAAAGFGLPIDHRIVSVVQIEDSLPEGATVPAPVTPHPDSQPAQPQHRPIVESVFLESKGDDSRVTVTLRWPEGHTTEGAAAAGASRETRSRGATVAVVKAMEQTLDSLGARIDVEHVMVHRVGPQESVTVRAIYYESGAPTHVVGSAIVHDDVATASVRALLQGVNRKLTA